MIGGPARYFRHNAFEPELAQIKRIDKRIYRANRIALINPFIEAFGQQSRLPTIRPNQEALHRSPPANREENHNIQNVFTQPGSFTSLWLLRSTVRMSASHPKAAESLRSSEMTLSAHERTSRPDFLAAPRKGRRHWLVPSPASAHWNSIERQSLEVPAPSRQEGGSTYL